MCIIWSWRQSRPSRFRKKPLTSPLTTQEGVRWGHGSERELLPAIHLYLNDLSAWQGTFLITKHLLFSLSCALPRPHPIPWFRRHMSLNCPPCPWLLHLWGSLMYNVKWIVLPVTLSYVNLIRLAKEPRRGEGKVFLPLHNQCLLGIPSCVTQVNTAVTVLPRWACFHSFSVNLPSLCPSSDSTSSLTFIHVHLYLQPASAHLEEVSCLF